MTHQKPKMAKLQVLTSVSIKKSKSPKRAIITRLLRMMRCSSRTLKTNMRRMDMMKVKRKHPRKRLIEKINNHPRRMKATGNNSNRISPPMTKKKMKKNTVSDTSWSICKRLKKKSKSKGSFKTSSNVPDLTKK